MRYLITGGAGFIGSHLVEHLVALGHEVVVLDDLSAGRRENLADVWNAIRFIEGSVTDSDTCRQAMERVDCALHQAAVTSVQSSVDHPLAAHEVNLTGTVNVLLAARDAGVRRVVFAGSTSAYGSPARLPNCEDHPTRPQSPYAASKAAAEQYCRAFYATYGLETVVLRYFNVFGPRQNPNSQYAAVVPRFISAALRGERPIIYGDGRQTRDFVHVANVVYANLLASQAAA
ncbi:MAG TPA: SDR family NAD(P)-dependent oxidoreductase, partial [Gemmatimonadales bacterium]|nr:SDR family NAD(P)-dependent oxidoreductase [Gemmatimonadales bacterium]